METQYGEFIIAFSALTPFLSMMIIIIFASWLEK